MERASGTSAAFRTGSNGKPELYDPSAPPPLPPRPPSSGGPDATAKPAVPSTQPPAQGRRGTGWVGSESVVDLIHSKVTREQSATAPPLETVVEASPEMSSPRPEDAMTLSTPSFPSATSLFAPKDSWKVSPVNRKRPMMSTEDDHPQEVDGKPNKNVQQQQGVIPVLRTIKSAREEPVTEGDTSNTHAVPWEQVIQVLDTNAVVGLTSEEAARRLEHFGKNKLAEAQPEPFWHKVFRQINSVLIYILLIAAAIAGGFQEWAEFGLILGVVAINVVIGLVQEGKAERATQALKAMLSSKATVIRDGSRKEINAHDVVPGDIVFIESGNKIPADIRLVSVSNLSVQESLLTGESLPVNKRIQPLDLKLSLGDRKNMAFSATSVVKGQATGVVVATGDETEIGKINSSVSEVKEEKTQLIKQVDRFGVWIGVMVVPVAVASFLLAFFTAGEANHDVANALIEAVAIAVAIIPEGLPAIITITLSLGTSHMASHHAIVKALPSVETLGSVMVICSDKTGTLTKNEMTVVAIQTRSARYLVHKVGYDPAEGSVSVDHTEIATRINSVEEDRAVEELAKAAVLCNDSRLEKTEVKGRSTVLPVGDPTEVALITLGEKLGLMEEQVRQENPRLGMVPFESEHKFMCTFHPHPTDDSKAVVYLKGAPDRLILRSANQLRSDLSLVAMDNDAWQKHAADLSGKGLRCLAVCKVEVDRSRVGDMAAKGPDFLLEAGQPFLTFLGLAAIMDPPRPECVAAITEAHDAGITVKMITGDHPKTAQAIGEALGIVDPEHPKALTGPELDDLTLQELRDTVMHCNVYARASPDNKICIIRALQAEGQVCSMTGDGVNDAPALRAADIGVAMGITGTDVSKDAAKMILTDDNFATILVAVKEGRRVWDNLRKLLVFNMPASFGQGGVVFFALCLQWQTVPLSAIQILYVNMITACTLGLMLAMEPAEADVMKRPPRSPKAQLMDAFFYWRTFYVATVFIVSVLGAVAWINAISGPEGASEGLQHAIALNTLVFCETTYAFNCRYLSSTSCHPRIFFGNPFAWICAIIMAGLQFLITYTPGLNDFFSMSPMTGPAWGITFLFAAVTFIIVEIEKRLSVFVEPRTRTCRSRLYVMFCSWRCPRVRCTCCESIDYEVDQQPKPTKPIPPRLKSGGSLKRIPDSAVEGLV